MTGTPQPHGAAGHNGGHEPAVEKSRPPSVAHPVSIHVIPGRMRLKGIPEVQTPHIAALVEKKLHALHGVRSVECHGVTHSVLVHFEPDTTSPDAIVHHLRSIAEIQTLHGTIEWENHVPPPHPQAQAVAPPTVQTHAHAAIPSPGHASTVHAVPGHPAAPPLSPPAHISNTATVLVVTIHVVPGSMRVHGVTELHERGICTLVSDILMHMKGVKKVDIDITTHSFRVQYDLSQTDPHKILKILQHQFALKSLQREIVWQHDHEGQHEPHPGHNIANKALMGAVKFALGHAASAVVGGPIVPAAGILLKLAGHPEPIHVLPDRIRLKVVELKFQPRPAAEVKAALLQLHGMQFVEIHQATGCVVLRFKKDTVTATHVIRLLRRHGYLQDMRGLEGYSHNSHEKEEWVKELMGEGALEVAEHLIEGLLF